MDADDDQASSGTSTPDLPPSPRCHFPVCANGDLSHASANGHLVPSEKKIDWEIPRKLLHSSIGFVTLYLYTSRTSPKSVVLVLWTAFAVILPLDLFRLKYPSFERLYERIVGFLMREAEKTSINGVVWYILGVNFVLSVYPLDVATVAILILSWADTAASTIGRMYGSRTLPLPRHLPFLRLPLARRKSLAGFIAASVTSACISIGFWRWIAPIRGIPHNLSWTWDDGVVPALIPAVWETRPGAGSGWLGLGIIGVLTGLASGVAEALDLGVLDDNLTLPIIAGGCILASLKALGLLA